MKLQLRRTAHGTAHIPICLCDMTFCDDAALEAALLASLEDADPEAVHRAAPPASKQLVKKLPREHLTHGRLQELGPGSVQCSVCRWDAFVSPASADLRCMLELAMSL